jgi:cytochrome c oxidase accessory protein FixG
VLERGRGLLQQFAAYDYVFRASRHPSAADNRVQAKSTITFDRNVAEPLPKFAPEELGDCIDCTICVQVCPVGIDIRNGLQYECIACGACVDACDDVMAKIGYPQGLIRYTTQNALDGKPTRVFRPRIFIYGGLLLALLAGFAYGVATRTPLIAEVLRDRNALYRETVEGIENGYTLKLVNKTDHAQRYAVALRGESERSSGMVLHAPVVTVPPGEVASVPVTVTAPGNVQGRHEVHFEVISADGSVRKSVESSFFGPM